MSKLTHQLQWTFDEVDRIKKAAVQKYYEAEAALDAAADIECEYWTRELVEQFPELADEYDDNDISVNHYGRVRGLPRAPQFLCTVSFKDCEERCIIEPPYKTWGGTSARNCVTVDVWHQTADGKKFRKDSARYRADEIIPFIKDLTVLKLKASEKREDMLKGAPVTAPSKTEEK
jgi:hypothetical protein